MRNRYKLFIDDVRDAPDSSWTVARSVNEAIEAIEKLGHPSIMSLDHDLGDTEIIMDFLKWYQENYYDVGPCNYKVHSSNPVGRDNIIAYLSSWRKSLDLE